MIACLVNGEATESISVNDRGFLYGQTVFETIVVEHGRPLLINEHFNRLVLGCERLSIPLELDALKLDVAQLCQKSIEHSRSNTVLRLAVSMGEGGRGYLNPATPASTRVAALYPFPDLPSDYLLTGIELGMCETRLQPQVALAGIKHGNRLEQITARSEWEQGWAEALLLDAQGNVIEATQSNLFLRSDKQLITPNVDLCGVAGIMRDQVLNAAAKLGFETKVSTINLQQVHSANEVFVSNSVIGLWPVRQFLETRYNNFSAVDQLTNYLRKHGAISSN